jgi:hypothetical protein
MRSSPGSACWPPQDLPAAAAWVLGVFSTSLAVYALVAGLGLLAATAFGVWAAAVALLTILGRREAASMEAKDLVGLALCAILAFLWCRDIAAARETTSSTAG